MRTLPIVVVDVVTKYSFEVTTTENEDRVEAFSPNGPHPTLRVGVGPWRSDRRLDHVDVFGAEHLVEAGGELSIAIPDEELDGPSAVTQVTL
jgi:hypothetical protein